MIFIAHRINTVGELLQVPKEYGVEVDLRDYQERFILQHEPFVDGENFEDYLKCYDHKLLILNIKSERIEFRVLELLKKYKVNNYFFLDSSFPMIYKLFSNGEKNIAVRFSEFEMIESVLSLKGLVKWVWVDCFSTLPLTKENSEIFKKNGFKLCFVSPDLVGREFDIEKYNNFFKLNNIHLHAVCAKIHNSCLWI